MRSFFSHLKIMAAILFVVAIIFSHCKKVSAPIDCHLPATVSFSHDILPIFNASCSTSGCHTSPSPKASLNLSAGVAYSQLFAKSEVDTLNPEKSLLYYHMNSFSGPMPPSGRLDNCTIKLVLRWIDQKAKNN